MYLDLAKPRSSCWVIICFRLGGFFFWPGKERGGKMRRTFLMSGWKSVKVLWNSAGTSSPVARLTCSPEMTGAAASPARRVLGAPRQQVAALVRTGVAALLYLW